MRIINYSFFLLILFFSYPSQAADTMKIPLKRFEKTLSDLSPSLSESIITVSDNTHNFSAHGSAVEEKSQFYIGSLTKQMTAYMLLQILQEKFPGEDLEKLLNQNLLTLFPTSKFLKDIDKAWLSKISLLDLLTHRSGLSDYISYYEHDIKNPELLNSPVDPISIFQTVSFDESKAYNYTNTNYFLLGKLIEEIANAPFDAIFDRLIKAPAKMDKTYAPVSGNYYSLKHESRFNRLMPDLNERIFIDMSNAIGTGNVISSVSDLIEWNTFLHEKASSEIKKIMFANYFYDDGSVINLGLSTESTNYGSLRGFQGGFDSYHSFLAYFSDYGLTMVLLSNNGADFEKIMDALGEFLTTPIPSNSLFFKENIPYSEKMAAKTPKGNWEI